MLKIVQMQEDEDRPIAHMRVCPPVPLVAARSSIVCYYFRDDAGEEGEHTFCYSTRFNEVLEELYCEEIGDDVYCDIECNYIRCRARKING